MGANGLTKFAPSSPLDFKQEFKDYKGGNGRKSKKTALLNLDLL